MSEPVILKKTPLWEIHRRVGAKMVPFGGWDMPVQYPTGILAEAKAVRSTAGLFDVSHMGRVDAHGPSALTAVETLTPNRAESLKPGFGHYTVLLNERAGIIDDLILFCQEPNLYPMIINASNRETDIEWIRSKLPSGVTLADRTLDTALLAIQGPLSAGLVAEAGASEASALSRFQRAAALLFNIPVWVMRTGYTGEDGFEIQCPADGAVTIWRRLLELAGPNRLIPCGLGARDVLRIEAAYPLYGHEINADSNPWEAGLGWILKKEEGFIGAEALAELKSRVNRRLTGLVMETRSVARQGAVILREENPVGTVTSGTFSPNRNASVALAYLDVTVEPEDALVAESGGRRQVAKMTKPPFVALAASKKKKAGSATA